MRAHELEALTEAVRSENRRIYALQAQFQYVQLVVSRCHMCSRPSRGYQPFHLETEQPSDHLLQNKIGIDWERVATKVNHRFFLPGNSVKLMASHCLRFPHRNPQMCSDQQKNVRYAGSGIGTLSSIMLSGLKQRLPE